ncbi:zinc finger BED domain-containing protein 4-like [Mercenaria mercenaria]|uniref:zinc finger BED domain-containing protein 4-like n=1 Tax=Mercenaria mercenaria TaxID=6596 RepID=UPI00234E74AA|nr:zinc finger BED domain-containing protein 4-like [Mercenaria mercenaria]
MNSLDQFDIPQNVSDKNETFKAKCRHCSSVISGSYRITSNFVTHLKRKHREIHLDTVGRKFQDSPLSPKITGFIKQVGTKYNHSDPKQKESMNALVNFIAGDLLPLSTVDSQYFKCFVASLDPKFQVPSRRHLSSKVIHEKARLISNTVKSQQKRAENICLTIDLWSNRSMKGFLGITAHYILDWEMKSAMMACKRFKGKHTAENILHEYEDTISSFDINDKIFCVISDNASNMIKAFKCPIPGFSSPRKSSKDDECDDDDDESCDDNDSDHDSCHEREVVSSKASLVKNIESTFPQHKRCYAHSLQLVTKDGLNECGANFKKVIAKVSKIVARVRNSVHASEILEDEKRLQAANATRLNSQLTMIHSVMAVPEEKLCELGLAVQLSAYDRKILNELSSILEPFEKATIMLQTERTASATILDPRFKLHWSRSESVGHHISKLKDKVADVCCVTSDSDASSSPTKRVKSDYFFSFLPESTPTRKRNQSGVIHEVDSYLDEPHLDSKEDPLVYWRKNNTAHPSFAKLATKYLSIPATSAPVERLFSIAGKVFRPDKMRLTDKKFETLMILKYNGEM